MNKKFIIVFMISVLLLAVFWYTSTPPVTSPPTINPVVESNALGSPEPPLAQGTVHKPMPKVIRWGSATVGGAGYVIITAFSDTISKYVTDFKSSSMATSGGSENVRLLHNGDIDFGQMTSSDFVKALDGDKPYGEPMTIYQGIGYRTNANMIHVLAKSGITSIEGLDGKKVAVGSASGAGRQMVEPGLLALGIKPEFVYGSWEECAEMLRSEQVTAAVFPIVGGNSPTSAVIQLNATTDIAVIALTRKQAQTMCDAAKGVSVVEIPAGYLDKDIPAFYAQGYHNALGVRPDVSEEVVYTVIKTLLEHVDELHDISKDLELFSQENAFAYMLPEVPIHPGAVRLYKEMGIWDDRFIEGK